LANKISIYLSWLDTDNFILRGELIQTFNILTDRPMEMEQLFFELSDTGYNLSGHSKRLTVNRCRLDSREYFFSNRVVHHWNNLTQEIVDARSVNVFNRGGFNGRPLMQWPTRPLGCWALEAPGPRARGPRKA